MILSPITRSLLVCQLHIVRKDLKELYMTAGQKDEVRHVFQCQHPAGVSIWMAKST